MPPERGAVEPVAAILPAAIVCACGAGDAHPIHRQHAAVIVRGPSARRRR